MKRMESAGWRWIVVAGVAGIAAGLNLGACSITEIPIGGDNVGEAGDAGSGGTGGSGGTTTGGSGGDTSSGGSVSTGGSTTGGSGGDTSSGGTPATGGSNSSGGSGGGTPSGCDAQDASGVGTCEPLLGARWNGAGCEIVWGCSCEGADCDDLWPSYEECAAAQQHCFDNATCSDERKEMRDLLNANKNCETTADCQTLLVGCGVTEDDCTGAVYANQSLDAELFAYHRLRLDACGTLFEGFGCANCERAARQAECIDGLCLGAASCALEASAVRYFINENNACTEDADCVQESVGCEVTQDDCTGAVYLASGFDDAEFKSLRAEYYACKGVDSCSACLRTVSPPACVGGYCQHR
jgi:hypothetical protein